MATKKASSSKAAPKRPVTKKSAAKKVATPVVTVAAKTGGKKLTFGEKVAALRPGALIAEFSGTFVLAGAIISLTGNGVIGSVAVALVLAVLVIVFGVVSGAHFNPAITIAQYVNRKVDGVKAVAYIFAQVVGALAAFGLLLGFFNATIDDRVLEKTFSQYGVTVEQAKEQLKSSGTSLEEWIEQQGGMEALKEKAGVELINVSMTKNQEWVTFLAELIGAIVFGLGVGYAVFNEKKNAIETGLAVGVSLLAGLLIGGATVILNPAVAAAIGGFEWANPFGGSAMTFWWPVFTYIGATVIGMTSGFTVYRFILKDALTKS